MNDGLINVLILLAVGAGSLLQWWLKKQRAAQPEARATDPSPARAGGSLEDMLSGCGGSQGRARHRAAAAGDRHCGAGAK
ncbi:MAG: hypothetical protein NTV22_10565 [bacterium]|nr:hypothetical protein [bacterium]